MTEDWYRRAIMYGVDVRRFCDSNGDGVGDLPGLIGRLDYLRDLGVTCLWLLPFFPTPLRDNGYDVTDYFRVDPDLGTIEDFVTLCHRAGERGIRVLVDVPANHTSDEHPWFQAARRDPGSHFHRYFTWSDAPPPDPPDRGPIVGDVRASTWTYDDVAGAYYYHRFYEFQPDLDYSNPDVRDELLRVLDFWLALGASAFRIDAVPIMIGTEGPITERMDAPHKILKEIRARVRERRADAALLGEVDVPPEELVHYFGNSDQLHMLFNFLLNNYLYLALAREERGPIVRVLQQMPLPPETGQWANFLRNLDELDLEQLSEDDRQDIYAKFAPEPEMRIYGRGLRRRLAPILEGDRRRMELAFSLLLSLPGTPVLVYGDEIGLGEDLRQEGRMAVRPPMQWSAEANAGFSSADSASLVQPVVSKGPFAYSTVNVQQQREDPDSFFHRVARLIAVRRQCEELSLGIWQLFETDNEAVLAHRCTYRDGIVIAVHNLSGQAQSYTLNLRDQRSRQLADLLDAGQPQPLDDGILHQELGPYAYRWFRVLGERAD